MEASQNAKVSPIRLAHFIAVELGFRIFVPLKSEALRVVVGIHKASNPACIRIAPLTGGTDIPPVLIRVEVRPTSQAAQNLEQFSGQGRRRRCQRS